MKIKTMLFNILIIFKKTSNRKGEVIIIKIYIFKKQGNFFYYKL